MTSPLSVVTPLGADALALNAMRGWEAISAPFSFELELLSDRDRPIPFEKLVGQAFTASIETGVGRRHLNGICARFTEGKRGSRFTTYRAEVVPQFFLLSRRRNSRTFQEMSVPAILKRVLQGLDVELRLSATYHPRDFVVQYRESDFDFASRLMEEEGIYYFFRHTPDGHTMVIADAPAAHPPVRDPVSLAFGPSSSRPGVIAWEKTQELRAGRVSLRDHSFELPGKDLDATATIQSGVVAGSIHHSLLLPANAALEIYDYPGEYAQRFDGIDPGGGERPGELGKIFEDARRTAEIRMQQEAAPSLVIRGTSNAANLTGGHRFALAGHHHADGEYVLTSVRHTASADAVGGGRLEYHNDFTCIPVGLPFRPARGTPRPTAAGPESAIVVGPAGEEVFSDKYGRVKVQFHWDREGKDDENSSCWVRVASMHAGQERGAIFPRIGQEVIVDFLEGDPDQPIIVGSVFNPELPPPGREAGTP